MNSMLYRPEFHATPSTLSHGRQSDVTKLSIQASLPEIVNPSFTVFKLVVEVLIVCGWIYACLGWGCAPAAFHVSPSCKHHMPIYSLLLSSNGDSSGHELSVAKHTGATP